MSKGNEPKGLYGADQLRRLRDLAERHMAKFEPDSVVHEVVRAGQRFVNDDSKGLIKTDKERRVDLARIEALAGELADKIDRLDARDYVVLSPLVGTQSLVELQDVARAESAGMQTAGRNPEIRRHWFVGRLADIYERSSGRRPGRSYDGIKQKEGGAFFEFVRAAIVPLNPEMSDGALSHIIRDVLAARNGENSDE